MKRSEIIFDGSDYQLTNGVVLDSYFEERPPRSRRDYCVHWTYSTVQVSSQHKFTARSSNFSSWTVTKRDS